MIIKNGDEESLLEVELSDSVGIQSVEKALVVLDALADRAGRYPATLAELTRRTGFHRSSVNRCIVSLTRAGYVQVDPETQRYSLGPKVLRLAEQFVSKTDVINRARPHLARLRDVTEETAFFSLLVNEQRVVVAQEESRLGLRRSMEIGAPVPLYCSSSSKAILAFAPPSLVERILSVPLPPCGPGASTDPKVILKQLREIRERGFALGQDEMVEGAGAVSAPVFNDRSQVIGAIGIGGPVTR
ncbi:MAG: IclR family transcriptional regulator, partial [Planctomycetaceae bacterium]